MDDNLCCRTLNPKLLVARANVRQHRAFRARVPWAPGKFYSSQYLQGFQGSLGSGKFYSSQYLKGSRVPWVPGKFYSPQYLQRSRVPGNLTVPSTSRVPGFPGFREILQSPVPPGFEGSLGSGKFYSFQYLQSSRVPWAAGNFPVPSTSRIPGFPGFRDILQFPVPPGFQGSLGSGQF